MTPVLRKYTGPGVFETALAYTSAMRMADNASLCVPLALPTRSLSLILCSAIHSFKLTAKNAGFKHNIIPSFMAKPHNNLPGCSGHVHISLVDPKTGKNIFSHTGGKKREGAKFKDSEGISEVAEHFVAGVLKGLPDIMPCLAPNVNSYKRLVEVSRLCCWSPIALATDATDS